MWVLTQVYTLVYYYDLKYVYDIYKFFLDIWPNAAVDLKLNFVSPLNFLWNILFQYQVFQSKTWTSIPVRTM